MPYDYSGAVLSTDRTFSVRSSDKHRTPGVYGLGEPTLSGWESIKDILQRAHEAAGEDGEGE